MPTTSARAKKATKKKATTKAAPRKTTTRRSANAQRREARSAGWAALGRAYEVVDGSHPQLDDDRFIEEHPWAKDLVEALRFLRTQTWQLHLDEHLNVFVSIPDDLDDLDLWGSLTHIIEATANAVRLLEDRQQQVVLEARRQGVTWTEIGRALGTTRQSAWARYSGED